MKRFFPGFRATLAICFATAAAAADFPRQPVRIALTGAKPE